VLEDELVGPQRPAVRCAQLGDLSAERPALPS
jgi:hypothetical protein